MTTARARFRFPGRLYAIIDVGVRGVRPPLDLVDILLACGVRLFQARAKQSRTRDFIDFASHLRSRTSARNALLIVNDRPDIARLVGADGVHLGQDDLPPEEARRLLGPDAIIGFSTHDVAQAADAGSLTSIDYIGFGPIFATSNKMDPDPCQGLAGLRQARGRTSVPIVAIGGITSESASAVIASGADAIAMIGALAQAQDPEAVARAVMLSSLTEPRSV